MEDEAEERRQRLADEDEAWAAAIRAKKAGAQAKQKIIEQFEDEMAESQGEATGGESEPVLPSEAEISPIDKVAAYVGEHSKSQPQAPPHPPDEPAAEEQEVVVLGTHSTQKVSRNLAIENKKTAYVSEHSECYTQESCRSTENKKTAVEQNKIVTLPLSGETKKRGGPLTFAMSAAGVQGAWAPQSGQIWPEYPDYTRAPLTVHRGLETNFENKSERPRTQCCERETRRGGPPGERRSMFFTQATGRLKSDCIKNK